MTVKTETNFYKNLKTLLDDGSYIVSRLESYVTPGFPDCLIFHNVTGFFTLELKVIQSNNKISLSPFQIAWNMKHAMLGAPVLYPGQPRSEGRGQIVSWLQNQGPRPYDLGPSARVIRGKARGPRLIRGPGCRVRCKLQTPQTSAIFPCSVQLAFTHRARRAFLFSYQSGRCPSSVKRGK
jgi:hypothetical protein